MVTAHRMIIKYGMFPEHLNVKLVPKNIRLWGLGINYNKLSWKPAYEMSYNVSPKNDKGCFFIWYVFGKYGNTQTLSETYGWV
jgi:hypothetical protein